MKRTLFTLIAVLVVGIASAAMAQMSDPYQQTPPAAQTTTPPSTGTMFSTTTGTILESTPTTLVIRTDTGERMTFAVDVSSQVLVSVPADRRVTVKYDTTSSGTYHVMNVSAVTPGPSEARTTVASTATDAMPQTASALTLVGLVGLAALMVGAILGLASRRVEPTLD